MPMTTSQLKQFALAVHNFAYGTEWDDEDIVSAMDFDVIIEKMKTDEKELVKSKNELYEELEKTVQEKEELLDDIEKHPDYEETITSTIEVAVQEKEELTKYVDDLQEQLNEESQERLDNKRCWMSVQKQYHELKHELKEEIEELQEALEVDEDGFADSVWFHMKMDKHIKYHLTDAGGDYNYIDETGKHVFGLGPVGTLDGAVEYVGDLKEENKTLKEANLSSRLSEQALLKQIKELKKN